MPKRALKSAVQKTKSTFLRLIYNRNVHFRNVENNDKFNFSLRAGAKSPGFSAMIRSKNEEGNIERCIRSIYNCFDEILYIDNGSTDSTLQIVTNLKQSLDKDDKIKIFEYPHKIARCGAEHAATDPNSLHSLVYFYNWCLSKATKDYVVKWDADLYLLPKAAEAFRSFVLRYQGSDTLARLPIQTVYIDLNGEAYEADGEFNAEVAIFPNRPYVRYHKTELYEILKPSFQIRRIKYPSVDVYEIKDTRQDEFAHWTDTNFPTPRKQREWITYNRVRNGEIAEGFTKVLLS